MNFEPRPTLDQHRGSGHSSFLGDIRPHWGDRGDAGTAQTPWLDPQPCLHQAGLQDFLKEAWSVSPGQTLAASSLSPPFPHPIASAQPLPEVMGSRAWPSTGRRNPGPAGAAHTQPRQGWPWGTDTFILAPVGRHDKAGH